MKKQITTIKLSKDTASLLNQIKIHPRQSYEEVILRLLQSKTGTKRETKRKNIKKKKKRKY